MSLGRNYKLVNAGKITGNTLLRADYDVVKNVEQSIEYSRLFKVSEYTIDARVCKPVDTNLYSASCAATAALINRETECYHNSTDM